jgi:beta-aspartyl-peptidase (threonine type)
MKVGVIPKNPIERATFPPWPSCGEAGTSGALELMRGILRVSSATLLLLMSACASSPARVGDPAAEVRAVWNTQVEAWNRGDLDGFMTGYWNSPDLVFFSNKAETRGWQQTLDRYRATYKAEGRQMGTLDFPQLEFKVLGLEAVLARGQWRLKMPDGKELTGMTSVTFQKLSEGWRIVHDHSSS